MKRVVLVIVAACGSNAQTTPIDAHRVDGPVDVLGTGSDVADSTTCSGWTSEPVDTGYTFDARLAITPSGTTHVVYYSQTDDTVRHASRDGAASFTIESLATAGVVGLGDYGAIGLELDAAGVLHVSHQNSSGTGLVYRHLAPGGTWIAEPTPQDGGCQTAIAVDGNSIVHLLCASGYEVVDYQRTAPSTFATVTVDSVSIATHLHIDPTIQAAVDNAGNVGVAYGTIELGSTPSDIRFAKLAPGGTWTTEPVDSNFAQGQAAIAFDGATPVIGYRGYSSSNELVVDVGRRGATAWTLEPASAIESETGEGNAVLVEPNGIIDVSFYDRDALQVKLARRAVAGTWTTELVASVGAYGTTPRHPTGLALDASGRLVVMYFDATDLSLKLARRCT